MVEDLAFGAIVVIHNFYMFLLLSDERQTPLTHELICELCQKIQNPAVVDHACH